MAGQGDKHSLRGQGLCYLLTPLHSAHACLLYTSLPMKLARLTPTITQVNNHMGRLGLDSANHIGEIPMGIR